jgi:hypothetical protein
VLTQSKRFPLAWPHLDAPVETWSKLLPETRTPFFARGAGWVTKPALGHEGYLVDVEGSRLHRWIARAQPWRWVAQRNFGPVTIETPHGPRFPCIGVFVVDGRPAGLYGRLAATPRIDADAQDVVVLVQT